jgi:hypothetical protein
MICYLDRTFCSYHEDCSEGISCPRAYTSEIHRKAQEEKLLVSLYGAKPECFKEKEIDESI